MNSIFNLNEILSDINRIYGGPLDISKYEVYLVNKAAAKDSQITHESIKTFQEDLESKECICIIYESKYFIVGKTEKVNKGNVGFWYVTTIGCQEALKKYLTPYVEDKIDKPVLSRLELIML